MGNPLRERRTPAELAAGRQVIEIADKIGDFERLEASVEADLSVLDPDKMPCGWRDTRVSGRLRFGFADAREAVPALEGDAAVAIDAVCQRCLEPMKLRLAVELKLLFAEGEYPGFDVWELEDKTVRPVDIVDEALVMAIPMTVLHAGSDDCRPMTDDAGPSEETTRPFATLRAQMDEKNSAG